MGPHSRRLGALAAFACLFAAGLSLATARAGRGNSSAYTIQRSLLVADFESLDGWRTHHAALRYARAGRSGARVLPSPTHVNRFWIYANPRPVQSSVEDSSYEASAVVRSLGRGQPVCLKLREVAAHRTVGTTRRCVWAVGRGWRVISLTYATFRDGSQVGLSVRG